MTLLAPATDTIESPRHANCQSVMSCVATLCSEEEKITTCDDLNSCSEQLPCFFDGSGGIRCRASDAPENSTADASETGKSGFSDFRKSDFRKSGKPENQDFRMFRFSGFSENRKIPKSGKKASDVEFAYVEFPLKSMVIISSLL